MQNVLVRPQAKVIQPIGSLTATNAIEFQAQLSAAVLSEQNSSLLIDMEKVELIDSAGLMALISALKIAQHLNKPFSLCSVSRSTQMVLELTQLDQVFEVVEHHTLKALENAVPQGSASLQIA